MNKPGPIALAAVAIAEQQAAQGVHEQGGNNMGPEVRNYLADVGLPLGQPWCAAFVHWCVHRAALTQADPANGLSGFPASGWCPALGAWAQSHGLWQRASSDAQAERGDLCLFYFSAKQRLAHVGFVTSPSDARCYFGTVEGNTGPDGPLGLQRDGDGVYAKIRSVFALGVQGGFVRLPF